MPVVDGRDHKRGIGFSERNMQHLLEAREQLATAMCNAKTQTERSRLSVLIAQLNKLIFA